MRNLSVFGFALTSFTLLLVSISAHAAPAQAQNPQLCVEEAAAAIIQYLQSEEPAAQLSIVKTPAGEVTAIKDAQQVINTLDFTDAIEESSNVRVIVFGDHSYIVFAKVDTSTQPNGSTCKVLEVDSGQDDQD